MEIWEVKFLSWALLSQILVPFDNNWNLLKTVIDNSFFLNFIQISKHLLISKAKLQIIWLMNYKTIEALEGGGGPSITYPFNYFEKYPISLKEMRQISPKVGKHSIPISPKLILVSHNPLNIYKNIPYPFKFSANIPVSLKTLPGPQYWEASLFDSTVMLLEDLHYNQHTHHMWCQRFNNEV